MHWCGIDIDINIDINIDIKICVLCQLIMWYLLSIVYVNQTSIGKFKCKVKEDNNIPKDMKHRVCKTSL